MKALTLWQPWASLVAFGEKKIETRSWCTSYRGLLAIHAAKRWKEDQAILLDREPFKSALHRHGVHFSTQLPRGRIVAVCWLRWCIRIRAEFAEELSAQEIAFGDYTPGRIAWILEDVQCLPEPVWCPGHQRLWNWSGRILGPRQDMIQDAIEAIRKQREVRREI